MRFDSTSLWRERHVDYTVVNQMGWEYCTKVYQITYVKDTTINLLNFHKLKKLGVLTYTVGWQCQNIVGNSQYMYFRQDTLLKKVWKLKPDYSGETLLYDFSKTTPGDTVKYVNNAQWGCCSPSPFVVTSMDSVLLGDGLYHKRINYNNSSRAIEGVGYDKALEFTEGVNVSNYYVILDCYSKFISYPYSTQTIFSYGAGTCGFLTGLKDSKNLLEQKLVLSPNPASNLLKIEGENLIGATIKIFDQLGKEILKTEFSNEINTEQLQNGVYQLIIQKEDRLSSKRFVIIK